MSIINSSKKLVDKVEEKVEKGLQTVKETFDNVARHLPFANLAKRSNDTFDIEIDLPGVKKEDIEITIEGNYLSVNAQRKYKNETKADDYYLCESSFGMFSRSFALSDNINRDKVDAKYEDGRLYITLEKEESKKSKKIALK
ncbi:Heat shock protein Hsp20 [Sulfurimonas denitrificans DSM 1251]|uniref:Heat shock protein Hsp20 n=1 Tax=Sulfurimonas denitrificans (strain ATCC 33889 / DSM 1251) TaxID=326298 RepID=Q30T87_SULDN|nr:Hsp20/alpha crystallin family protein [Sulfurimonas denitrificans]ABB43794.1 Heat shock protein Hsp20 [Sulfurimonas denitrificans DSM 1251]MDD3442465.1 Hsp20/alpha crystallin family protein [Sulfurimonas denitrificans]